MANEKIDENRKKVYDSAIKLGNIGEELTNIVHEFNRLNLEVTSLGFRLKNASTSLLGPDGILSQPVAGFGFGEYIENRLTNNEILFIGDVVQILGTEQTTEKSYKKSINYYFGQHYIEKINRILQERGLSFDMKIPLWKRPEV